MLYYEQHALILTNRHLFNNYSHLQHKASKKFISCHWDNEAGMTQKKPAFLVFLFSPFAISALIAIMA
ncbi:MAG: hypothetical protein M3162_08375, partial [Thermoproteota archaeon]|nr:hypothetical protein [Thermoproteota archaeon]